MDDQDFTGTGAVVALPGHTGPWHSIKASSVLAFAQRVAAFMGEPENRELIGKLTEMALSNGAAWFEHGGHRYTGPQVLMIYGRHGRPEESMRDPFLTKAQWDEFCAAMRVLEDPDTAVWGKAHWHSMGKSIDARQRPHAVAKGWA